MYDETLPLLILRTGIYSEPKFGHITEFCPDNNKTDHRQKFEGAGAYRFVFCHCWETFIHYINKLRLVHEGSEIRRTDVTDETANIPEDPDM